jgi:hypothetical protein
MKAAAEEGGEGGADDAGADGAPKPKRSDTGTRRRKRTRAATKT